MDGWAENGGALERELGFASFSHAIEFVNRLAELAERENHHPEIRVSGSRVTSAGGRTRPAESRTAITGSPG